MGRSFTGKLVLLGVAMVPSLACGCSTPDGPATTQVVASNVPAAAAPATPTPYPFGRWRSNPGQMDSTMVWLSHILIRHNEVEEAQVGFDITGWKSTEPPSTRTRREALALSEKLAQTARERGNFEELARQHSEDPPSRARSGSLGGMIAGHFTGWPRVMDAIETLKPGEVSRVVETAYGYHVFLRREPVPEETVSGAHIVIAHDEAPWIEIAARRAVPRRSRAEALELAMQVFEQAKRKPSAFAALVDEYSEHRDAVRAGDFGTWSTRELTGYPYEIETAAHLKVGEVAAPIDTRYGYQIILRTPNEPRQQYAMTKIQLTFDPSLPKDDPHSKATVFEKARGLAAMLEKEPSRFGPLQLENCCAQPLLVVEGRDVPALEATLAKLNPGEIAREPVEDVALEYLIPRRLELAALPPLPETRYDF